MKIVTIERSDVQMVLHTPCWLEGSHLVWRVSGGGCGVWGVGCVGVGCGCGGKGSEQLEAGLSFQVESDAHMCQTQKRQEPLF